MKTAFLLLAAALPAVMPVPALHAGPPPNIVVILADDLGYGDLSCYGATKIKTPHVDRLAREGMRFTDAHAAASVCSPSRYGLMTGRYPWRLHRKGNDYRLEPGRPTLASLLRAKGYRAAAIGKWHLGYGPEWEHPLVPGPLEAGFDYHFGVPTNHNDHFRAFVENREFFGLRPGESLRVVKGQQFPSGLAQPRVEDQVDTTLTAKALGFIRENRAGPFFLYFTPCAVHTHVTPAARFRGTSQCGLFGDYAQELDAHVGEILALLDELGLAGRTLVVFSSDNGSTPNDFKGTQGTVLNLADDGGDIREKFKTAKRDARAMGHITNGPWHDGKGTPYEGGHRVPFIARWPEKVPPGTSSDQTLCLTDLFATFAAILGVPIPEGAAEDSFDMLPVLLGDAPGPVREFAFIQGDTRDRVVAVRSGKWKLIETGDGKGGKSHQLFDLVADPGENTDIAGREPGVVGRLAAALEAARREGRTRP